MTNMLERMISKAFEMDQPVIITEVRTVRQCYVNQLRRHTDDNDETRKRKKVLVFVDFCI